EAPAGSGEQPSFRLRAARDGPSAGQAVRRPPERAEARVDPASHEEAEDAARRGAQGRGHGALAPFAVVLSPWPSGPGCSRAFALAVAAWLQSRFRLGRRGLAAVALSPWPSASHRPPPVAQPHTAAAGARFAPRPAFGRQPPHA